MCKLLSYKIIDFLRLKIIQQWKFIKHLSSIWRIFESQCEDANKYILLLRNQTCCFAFFRESCFPIRIPDDDSYFSDKCMEFVRSAAAPEDNCVPGTERERERIPYFLWCADDIWQTLQNCTKHAFLWMKVVFNEKTKLISVRVFIVSYHSIRLSFCSFYIVSFSL